MQVRLTCCPCRACLHHFTTICEKPGGGALPPPGADVIATFAQSDGLQDSAVGGEAAEVSLLKESQQKIRLA